MMQVAPFNDSILGKLDTDRLIDSLILSKRGQNKRGENFSLYVSFQMIKNFV